MSAEQKKLLWISLSACAFVLALAATGFFLFAPKKAGATAPATIGNIAAPKSADPQDFLQAPPPAPTLEQPRESASDVVVIYGEKPASLDGAAAPAVTPQAPAAAAAPAPAPAAPAVSPAPAGKQAPAAAAKPKAAAAKTVKVDEYWIQAASFSSRTRADELKTELAAKGIAALISVKDIDGKSWYRVRIGPYATKAEAEGWLGRLKELPGCSEAYVSKTVVERKG